MAVFALTDMTCSVGGTDLSDHVRSQTLEVNGELLDTSAMGSAWRTKIQGARDWRVTIEFNDDFAASEVDATMWSAWNGAASVAWVAKPTSSAVSATNPSLSGSVFPASHPVGGSWGQVATKSITLEGTGALTRATS